MEDRRVLLGIQEGFLSSLAFVSTIWQRLRSKPSSGGYRHRRGRYDLSNRGLMFMNRKITQGQSGENMAAGGGGLGGGGLSPT